MQHPSSNSSDPWCIGHKDLAGGWAAHLRFNTAAEYSSNQFGQAPTSTHWSNASGGLTNENGRLYIAMLFASVDGISKVGSFTPDSSGSFTVTTGFTPRFILMKPRNSSDNNWSSWWVYDSLRGLTSGQNNRLQMSSNAAQIAGSTNGTTATGINFTGWGDQSAYNWIYYAHA